MILDLKKVFSKPNVQVAGKYNLDLSGVKLNEHHPFISPVAVLYFIKSNNCSAVLTLNTKFNFSCFCDRCAEKIEKSYEYIFSHSLISSLENSDNDNYILIKDYKINLDSLVYEDILLKLPSKFLCHENCKGLCSYCGKNLNYGSCNCNEKHVDSRFEALKKLINE